VKIPIDTFFRNGKIMYILSQSLGVGFVLRTWEDFLLRRRDRYERDEFSLCFWKDPETNIFQRGIPMLFLSIDTLLGGRVCQGYPIIPIQASFEDHISVLKQFRITVLQLKEKVPLEIQDPILWNHLQRLEQERSYLLNIQPKNPATDHRLINGEVPLNRILNLHLWLRTEAFQTQPAGLI